MLLGGKNNNSRRLYRREERVVGQERGGGAGRESRYRVDALCAPYHNARSIKRHRKDRSEVDMLIGLHVKNLSKSHVRSQVATITRATSEQANDLNIINL